MWEEEEEAEEGRISVQKNQNIHVLNDSEVSVSEVDELEVTDR